MFIYLRQIPDWVFAKDMIRQMMSNRTKGRNIRKQFIWSSLKIPMLTLFEGSAWWWIAPPTRSKTKVRLAFAHFFRTINQCFKINQLLKLFVVIVTSRSMSMSWCVGASCCTLASTASTWVSHHSRKKNYLGILTTTLKVRLIGALITVGCLCLSWNTCPQIWHWPEPLMRKSVATVAAAPVMSPYWGPKYSFAIVLPATPANIGAPLQSPLHLDAPRVTISFPAVTNSFQLMEQSPGWRMEKPSNLNLKYSDTQCLQMLSPMSANLAAWLCTLHLCL